MRARSIHPVLLELGFLLACVALASPVVAQDAAVAPDGPPVHHGRERVQASVSSTGGVFELDNGAKLMVPAGLPIGTRTFTFGTSHQRPRPSQVAQVFTLHGPTLMFDGAINATSNPVVVSLRARTLTRPTHSRLVLAVEQAGVCTPTANVHLPNGLCSTWELVDATYDEPTGLIQASVATPGGFRLQFGFTGDG